MWLIPYLSTRGFFGVAVASSVPSAFFCARALRRSFFSALLSGRYLCNSLKSWVAEKNRAAHKVCSGTRCSLTRLLVQCLLELVDAGWNLQALVQHLLLTLQTDVVWPSHEPGHVTFGLDAATLKRTVSSNVTFSAMGQGKTYRSQSSLPAFRSEDLSLSLVAAWPRMARPPFSSFSSPSAILAAV